MNPMPAAPDAILPKQLETLLGLTLTTRQGYKAEIAGMDMVDPDRPLFGSVRRTKRDMPMAARWRLNGQFFTSGRPSAYDLTLPDPPVIAPPQDASTLLARAIDVMVRSGSESVSDQEWDAIIADGKAFLAGATSPS